MKKTLCIIISIVLAVVLLTACATQTAEVNTDNIVQAQPTDVQETSTDTRSAYISITRELIDEYCESGLTIPDDNEWEVYDYPEGFTSASVSATRSNGNGDFIIAFIEFDNGEPIVHLFYDVNDTYIDDGVVQ